MIDSEVCDASEQNKALNLEEPPKEEDIKSCEKGDKEEKQDTNLGSVEKVRTKRFFGVLMGTLNKFNKESRKKTDADIKREQINQKLQEKLLKEKEELQAKIEQEKRQKQAWKEEAIRERQRKEMEKMALSKLKDEASRSHFLCTVSEPKIFYLPRKLLPELEAQISIQKKQISEKSDSFEQAKV